MEIKSYNYLPDEAFYVRTVVFIEEQGFVDEMDDIDNIATHLVMFDNSKPIATSRIFIKDNPEEYILGRLAVIKERRGENLGSKMLKATEEKAKELGAKVIKLHAQVRAMDFYQKNGYEAFGEVEYEEDCPHMWMRKEV